MKNIEKPNKNKLRDIVEDTLVEYGLVTQQLVNSKRASKKIKEVVNK